MKITDIKADGTEYYWSDRTNWQTPEYGPPSLPVTRVDNARYTRWSSGVYPDSDGRLIKILIPANPDSPYSEATHRYVPGVQVKGLYSEVYPAIKAHCDEREATRAAQASATKLEQEKIAQAMRSITEAVAPVAFISWEVTGGLGMALTRYENCVRLPLHSVEVILAHIEALQNTVDARDVSIEELEGDLQTTRRQVEQARSEAYHNRTS